MFATLQTLPKGGLVKLNIAYVEDDRKQRDYISKLFYSCMESFQLPINTYDLFSSKEDFLAIWYPRKYDLVLLDIFLDENLGIDIAKEMRKTDKEVNIVFCSSSNEFACESYELHATYYITKPVTYNKMSHMVEQLARQFNTKKECICLDDGQTVALVEIIYTEYYNHCITVHLRNSIDIKTWMSQKDFIRLIEAYPYMLPITSGNVINLKEVISFEKGIFTMSDKTILHTSLARKRDVSKAYKSFVFEELNRW